MVEPPIKKSDKAAAAPVSQRATVKPIKKADRPPVEASFDESQDSGERRTPRQERGRDKGKGRGRGDGAGGGNRNSDARPSNVNPALMRGPKPSKPKPPPVIAATETEGETTEAADEAEVQTPETTAAE